jgi:penicillin amidase
MVGVEAGGRAGRVIAAHLPRRENGPAAGLIHDPGRVWELDDLVPAADFPSLSEEIVVSANDRPPDTPVPIGFFFSPQHRMRRLWALLEEAAPVTAATMREVQLDVVQDGVLNLRDALLARLPAKDATVQVIAAWDGAYGTESRGALAFEALAGALARRRIPQPKLDLLSAIWTGRALIAQHVAGAPEAVFTAALQETARVLRRYRTWGSVHRLALRHPLAMLPVVGRWFAGPSLPMAGGNDTVNKTGHGLVRGRHRVTFGSCARHVSDLSDPDANWFVLLGGQDGWLGSANLIDQTRLWREGKAITVPLRHEATRGWPHQTRLQPQ